MNIEINCGKCFEDTEVSYETISQPNVDIKCKCGNYLVKNGEMKLR